MTTDPQTTALLRRAIAIFGERVQLRRLIEEAAECIVAIAKYQDGRSGVTPSDLATEVVGCLITAAQAELILVELIGCDEMNRIWSAQLDRLRTAVEVREGAAK